MKAKYQILTLFLAVIMALMGTQMAVAAAPGESADLEPIETAFTDPTFLKAVRELVGKTNDEHIYRSDVESITRLLLIPVGGIGCFDPDLNGYSNLHGFIECMDGIEYFTGLEELYCYGNDFTELDLSHAPNLEVLDCSFTNLESIDLSNCPKLKHLDCNNTFLQELNISGNPKLEVLICSSTDLTTLDVSNNPLLERLDAWGAKLEALDVSNNPRLEYLDVALNNMKFPESVTGMENYPELQDIFLFYPQNAAWEGHDWDEGIITVEATCTRKGEKIRTCKDCGATLLWDEPSEWHSWGPWEITVEPTLITTGKAQRVCTNGEGHTGSAVLPVLTDVIVWEKGEATDGLQEYISVYGTVTVPITAPDKPVISTPGSDENDKSDIDKFTDVMPDAWYYDAVKQAVDSGLLYGTSDTKFSPESPMTRGMLVTLLHRAAGEPASSQSNFSDVPEGRYYTKAIAWASENKIVSGYGNGRFGPEDYITREQLASILYRWAGSPETAGTLLDFKDNGKVSNYAQKPLCWAYENKIVSGKGNGILDPRGKATRAEAAAILMSFLKR